MRKRIKELAEGKIECIGPAIEFSIDKVEIEVLEGKDFCGEFSITSKNAVPMRGMIYSSNPRMECLNDGFEGTEVLIRYAFHSSGLIEGDKQEGEFFLVCNQGEYALPFAASVFGMRIESSIGVLNGLSDFARLAKDHWQEAKRLFYSPAFSALLKHGGEKERLLHAGLLGGAGKDGNLEEFLTAARLKKQIFIQTEKTEYLFLEIAEQIFQEIALFKNTWGHAELFVRSDADFIVPAKRRITEGDFLGSRAGFGFYVMPDRMHAGKNFGRLVIWNIHQEISISVCASLKRERPQQSLEGRKMHILHAKLLQSYTEYRLKKIVTGRWTFQTGKILDDLIALDPANEWYRLFKAQALWMNGQRQESEWILNDFKRKHRDKKSPQWGYYLYICTLIDREELYVDRLTEEIEQIYLEHREELFLFWCLLFLRKDYVQSGHRKLKALEEKIMGGIESPLLYVEAYLQLCEEPYLMGSINDFSIKILNWARKQGMLTKALVDQAVSVFPEKLSYRRTVFLLLEECYNLMDCAKILFSEKPKDAALADDKRVLAVFCGYLIRNQMYGAKYFPWYARGVAEKLRIAGLYEAYLLSMDAKDIQEVPRIIRMYFKYNNQLGSRQKAVLYANMIAAKEMQKEDYRQQYPAMEKFAYEQMELGHMDDYLAVIYKEALSLGIYSSQVSDALADVLFVHRLTCAHPDAVRVIVLQEQLRAQRVVPLIGHAAYFPLYSNDYSILIEDRYGNRYGGSVDYQLEKLMHPGKYIKSCMKYSPMKLPYLLYYFSDRKAQEFFEEKDLDSFLAVMAEDGVDPAYKARLFPKMFFLMQNLNMPQEMEREIGSLDLSLMPQEGRNSILASCIGQKLYEQAFRIVKEYGFGQEEIEKRVPFISDQIEKSGFAEEKVLLLLCADTFFRGSYDDIMLNYLCRYYSGPNRLMAEIFGKAKERGIDTAKIAQRLLWQMLYTDEFADCTGEVYRSCGDGQNAELKDAYLTCFSYRAFLEKGDLPDGFFESLRKRQADGSEMNLLCSLAMLSHYADNPALMKQDEKQAEKLLQKLLFRGMYFAFYQKLSQSLQIRYQLYDKYVVEYRGKAGGRAWICYSREEEEGYFTEEMPEVYEGIFIKKMILFAGETVRYRILEEADGQRKEVHNGIVSRAAAEGDESLGRYGRLNGMLSLSEPDGQEGLLKMKEYSRMDQMADESFTIIR